MVDIPGNSSTTTNLTIGSSISDQLEVVGDRDWIRVTLTAGQGYSFSLNGTGATPLGDPYIRLRDASGNLIAEDDDGGATGYNSLLTYIASTSGTYYIEVGGYNDGYSGGYTLGSSVQAPLPSYTNTQIAAYLTDGFWEDTGRSRHAFASTTITYNITGLTAEGQALALAAFQVWKAVGGFNFVATTGAAQLTFDDSDTGAYADYVASGGTTTSATVNVGLDWLADYGTTIGSYSFQTYVHEIGHALGLGHAGDYNGSAGWQAFGGGDNHYLNDSWQATVMSYFDQDENTAVNATDAYLVGVMMADIIAIQDLYGVPTNQNTGNTTYGFGNTATGYYNFSLFDEGDMVGFTIFDSGGNDTLNASGFTGSQLIDLRAGYFSNIGGEIGNIGIAANTTIENATGGSGNDRIVGNNAANILRGGAGADRMQGLGGNDMYYVDNANDDVVEAASGGTDTVAASVSYALDAAQQVEILRTTSNAGTGAINLTGNEFVQTIYGNNGANALNGRGGADTMYGLGGNDTYYVDNANDNVIEAVGGGTDTVAASVSYALDAGQQVEVLRTTSNSATGAINLTGNEFNQTIYGNNGVNVLNGLAGADTIQGLGGNDIINGGTGIDTLYGGAGLDSFVFDSALIAGNADRIIDFVVADDTIRLDRTIFTAFASNTGSLSGFAPGAFNTGAAATQADDRIIYNSATGALIYDANGVGGAAGIQFATLSAGLSLTAADFFIVT